MPPEGQIKPEDIVSQFMVLRTKSILLYIYKLIATGLNFVVDALHQKELENTLCQQAKTEKPRIVLAPALPK
jgi:hypothetical protein